MKRIFIVFSAVVLVLAAGIVYGTGRNYQLADVYVCDQSIVMAELQAMTKVSRQDLYVVSYCNCMGFDNDLKSEVRDDKCEPPKDSVFLCSCVGKSHY